MQFFLALETIKHPETDTVLINKYSLRPLAALYPIMEAAGIVSVPGSFIVTYSERNALVIASDLIKAYNEVPA